MQADGSQRYREYKVHLVTESSLGTILLGASALPLDELQSVLNREALDGWQFVFMVVERRRHALFWQRDAVILTLGR